MRIAQAMGFMVHAQRERSHARLPHARPGQQARDQHARTGHHLLRVVGSCEQLDALLEYFRADDRLARIRRIATRTVEIGQQRGAEAPRQPGARQMPQVGELPQAHALQRFPVFAAGAEQPHRRIVKKALQRAEVAAVRAVHEITAPAREHGCTERRGGARELRPVAERMQHALQAIDQSWKASEKTQAGLHLEQHDRCGGTRAVAGLRADHRSERKRCIRGSLQGLRIARRIGLPEHKIARQRERSGAFGTRLNAQLCGTCIHLCDAVRFDQRHRPVAPGRVHRGGERLQRQLRQVHGDPQHATRSRHVTKTPPRAAVVEATRQPPVPWPRHADADVRSARAAAAAPTDASAADRVA